MSDYIPGEQKHDELLSVLESYQDKEIARLKSEIRALEMIIEIQEQNGQFYNTN